MYEDPIRVGPGRWALPDLLLSLSDRGEIETRGAIPCTPRITNRPCLPWLLGAVMGSLWSLLLLRYARGRPRHSQSSHRRQVTMPGGVVVSPSTSQSTMIICVRPTPGRAVSPPRQELGSRKTLIRSGTARPVSTERTSTSRRVRQLTHSPCCPTSCGLPYGLGNETTEVRRVLPFRKRKIR